MFIIFDTYGGLCNQFFDILCGTRFCLAHNIPFTFRYCSLRQDNLISWYNMPFNILFDDTFLTKFELYKPYDTISHKCTIDNVFTLTNNTQIISRIKADKSILLNELISINTPFIVISQCNALMNNMFNTNDIKLLQIQYKNILPSKRLYNIYTQLIHELCLSNTKYNALHYRYEHDFTHHGKLPTLTDALQFTVSHSKNPHLPIYIAASNASNLILDIPITSFPQLVVKNDQHPLLNSLNFEENAVIDFLISSQSVEVFGHRNSSFSVILNILKHSNNYYNT